MIKISKKSEINNINLKEIDIYTQTTFEELQYQRFMKFLEYHICVVRQNEKTYLFDALKFIEDCIHNQKVVNNPLTKEPIKDFDILVSTKESPEFKLYMKKDEVLKHPNHYPIAWNSPSINKVDRLFFKYQYARYLESKNLQSSIALYQKAIEEGDLSSRLRLVKIYQEEGNKTQAISLLHDSLEVPDIAIQNLIFCGDTLKDCDDLPGAFKAYHIAATRKSLYGIGEVVYRLENGLGVEKNELLAKEWRQKLPGDWKKESVADFFKHLQEIEYNPNRTEYP